MKKMLWILSVIASAVVLVSCASQSSTDQTSMTQAAPAHPDYKGESSMK